MTATVVTTSAASSKKKSRDPSRSPSRARRAVWDPLLSALRPGSTQAATSKKKGGLCGTIQEDSCQELEFVGMERIFTIGVQLREWGELVQEVLF